MKLKRKVRAIINPKISQRLYLKLIVLALFVIAAGVSTGVPGRAAADVELSGPVKRLSAAGTCDPDGVQASGAIYRICMPSLPGDPLWNGDLIIFAHGYVSPTEPVGIPENQFTLNGISIAEIVNGLGYAFATTSYSTNGLAVRQGVLDLVDLASIFIATKGTPAHIYLIGASEGGLITTLAIERYAGVFDGGLAMCGPYGDFGDQINYFGDFRVIFDHFFPSLLPASAVNIPQPLIDDWETHYQTVVKPVIEDNANLNLVDQLLNVTGAPYDSGDTGTKTETIEGLLWYNVFSTNDGIVKLGGQPFDNQNRTYTGSADDTQLNQAVARFAADQTALDEIATYYQPTGKLFAPLVTLHTTGDPIVPYWHVTTYQEKTVQANNAALHEHIKVERYGHCIFTSFEVLAAFNLLRDMVNNPPFYQIFVPYAQS